MTKTRRLSTTKKKWGIKKPIITTTFEAGTDYAIRKRAIELSEQRNATVSISYVVESIVAEDSNIKRLRREYLKERESVEQQLKQEMLNASTNKPPHQDT